MAVVIETTLGAVTVDLYLTARPKICKNFLKLCKVKFYNFQLFHNVQPGFIAQSGDPTGTGRGGESIYKRLYGDQATYFEGELLPKIKHEKKGTISMVGAGNNMFGSQFFFTLDENLDYLDTEHSVFGEVTEGFEVLEKFNNVISDETNRPYQDIRVTHTVVLEDPFEDPERLEIPPQSPVPDPEMLKSSRLGADEEITDDSDVDPEELAEKTAEKEAKARATILEMIGDIPDAECAPPENVLFVCKLNPVTTEDDLEIIFSRFGKVVSCEVIKDQKTGDSLQYAFVEFDNPKSCETAYFKMDNVLIDDRRIHVDFSQSVAKYKWKGKGRLEVFDDDGKKTKNRDFKEQKEKHDNDRRRRPDKFQNDKRDRNDGSRSKDRGSSRNRTSPPRRKVKSRSRSRDRSKERSSERRHKRRSRSRDRHRRSRTRSRSRSKNRPRRSRSRDRRDSKSSRDRRRSRSRETHRRDRSSGKPDRRR